jgi:AraC-like DNA-binding protein
MWEHYYDPLTLAELAKEATLSPFYFSRLFRFVTGTSPVRFLSAVRLYKAKNLLLETSFKSGEIAYMVGYNSNGTFTSRFTKSVGVSPARFRYMSEAGALAVSTSCPDHAAHRGSIRGMITIPDVGARLRAYIGAFATPIAEGLPVACDIVDTSGRYELKGIPDGRWYTRATAVAVENFDPRPWRRRPLLVGSAGPVQVRADAHVGMNLEMRGLVPTDLPVLLALPELDCLNPPAIPVQRRDSVPGRTGAGPVIPREPGARTAKAAWE